MGESFSSGHNDEQLVRYLLDLLPEQEAECLDEMSIADDEVARRLQETEDRLVDAYVDGGLTGETLARFESVYLTSPRRRDRVTFAREFRRAANESTAAAREEIEPVAIAHAPVTAAASAPVAMASSWRGTFIWKFGLVAAAIACVVLLFQAAGLRRSVEDLTNQNAALDRHTSELAQQLEQARAAHAALVASASLTKIASDSPSQTPISSAIDADRTAAAARPPFVLLPETRAVGAVAVLDVPLSTLYTKFELRLESNEFPQYQVTLKDPATNRGFWRTGWIAAVVTGNVPMLAVIVPLGELKPQHYSFDVTGRRPGHDPELVTSYTFQRLPR